MLKVKTIVFHMEVMQFSLHHVPFRETQFRTIIRGL